MQQINAVMSGRNNDGAFSGQYRKDAPQQVSIIHKSNFRQEFTFRLARFSKYYILFQFLLNFGQPQVTLELPLNDSSTQVLDWICNRFRHTFSIQRL
jgi:hypothetical protein